MPHSDEFFKGIIDAMTEHVVVINTEGEIEYVNRGWVNFGQENSCMVREDWTGINYLKACDSAAESGEEFGKVAARGIRQVMRGAKEQFYFEYPCHSPAEQRWFMMRVTRLHQSDDQYYVITHQNITERKLAEAKVLELAILDGLTGIHNRRHFDDFFEDEWRRCSRLKIPISLALIDVDYFKKFNDHYGHLKGDDCLKQLAAVIRGNAQRPGDLAARFGGEEFALILGNTDRYQAETMLKNLKEEIERLHIPHDQSSISAYVTVSIGLVSVVPAGRMRSEDLLDRVDKNLYLAKNAGRNQIVAGSLVE